LYLRKFFPTDVAGVFLLSHPYSFRDIPQIVNMLLGIMDPSGSTRVIDPSGTSDVMGLPGTSGGMNPSGPSGGMGGSGSNSSSAGGSGY
ncbi:MAG: hypothetical protein Q7J20_07440, partial [Candidatus Nitrotoga sp.]|nr:hypothetical protein [Candidatus Nitrotoga sp.]